jgi:hypothetical protein
VEFQGVAGVPFNKPFMTDEELDFIREAYASHYLAGDGKFTNLCRAWLDKALARGLCCFDGSVALRCPRHMRWHAIGFANAWNARR